MKIFITSHTDAGNDTLIDRYIDNTPKTWSEKLM
jgi:hypothetical protein